MTCPSDAAAAGGPAPSAGLYHLPGVAHMRDATGVATPLGERDALALFGVGRRESANVALLREAARDLEAGTLPPRHAASILRLAAALLARAEGDAEGLGVLAERWWQPILDALVTAARRRVDADGVEGGPPSVTFWSASVSIDPGLGGCTFSAPTLVEAAALLREAGL